MLQIYMNRKRAIITFQACIILKLLMKNKINKAMAKTYVMIMKIVYVIGNLFRLLGVGVDAGVESRVNGGD